MRSAVALAALIAVGVSAAHAQNTPTKKKKRVVTTTTVTRSAPAPVQDATVVRIGGVTRIIVNRRSYLDAGTETSTGDRGYRDYAMPPGGDPGRPNWDMGPDRRGAGRWPLPSAFDLPGYNPNTPF